MTADSEAKAVEKIAPDGDVVFSLENGATCVQVSSGVMKSASPVFAAMLGPNFKEGHALATHHAQPIEIPLPDDDPKGFILICRILHFQRGLREQVPTLTDLLHVRPVADKYDLLDPISLRVEAWIKKLVSNVHGAVHGPLPPISFQTGSDVIQAQTVSDEEKGYSLDISDTFLLLILCYEFGAQDDFRVISQRIMREHIGSFITLATNTEPISRGLVDTGTLYLLAGALQTKRAHLLAKLSNFLQMGMFNHLIDDPHLEPEHVVQYFDLFNGYHDGAWAIFEDSDTGGFLSLHEVLICLANLRPNDFPDMDETCRSSIENLLKTEVEEIGEDVAGLCLICVRKGLVECDSNHDVTSS
ncbi:hypothetical protein BGZ61DRAFT_591336 [Ilyonectria robusta]|uniref:uncharacterized protein n=1 Tax=Ilyonectria robusta TaxID=1079257 RepID=UPI001E8E6A40|nr:uncharacterized protein BGZ61DRAFT_591336 [Ilyonectria robusta]KAH8675009.1 hypothetical protein BGZ61DRAFT_591336 [Ilyonectria robusta]